MIIFLVFLVIQFAICGGDNSQSSSEQEPTSNQVLFGPPVNTSFCDHDFVLFKQKIQPGIYQEDRMQYAIVREIILPDFAKHGLGSRFAPLIHFPVDVPLPNSIAIINPFANERFLKDAVAVRVINSDQDSVNVEYQINNSLQNMNLKKIACFTPVFVCDDDGNIIGIIGHGRTPQYSPFPVSFPVNLNTIQYLHDSFERDCVAKAIGTTQYGQKLNAKVLLALADLGLDPDADKLKAHLDGIQGDEEQQRIIKNLEKERKKMLTPKTDLVLVDENGGITESKILPHSDKVTAILDELLDPTGLDYELV